MSIPDIQNSIAQLAAAQVRARDATKAAKIAAMRAELEQSRTAALIALLSDGVKAARAPAGGKKTPKGR